MKEHEEFIKSKWKMEELQQFQKKKKTRKSQQKIVEFIILDDQFLLVTENVYC